MEQRTEALEREFNRAAGQVLAALEALRKNAQTASAAYAMLISAHVRLLQAERDAALDAEHVTLDGSVERVEYIDPEERWSLA